METISIIYQLYNVHFHLKQDSDLKIPLNGLKMNQLDHIWFQIKRKIPFKLTCCDPISKIAAQFIFELLPLTNQLRNIQAAFPVPSNFTQNQTMLRENGPKDIFQNNIF